ncbi:MAG TPA: hypothetical protein VMM18_04375 [Gemmatimonadaceae bacterium]|nr:hypothetical protein [Gemmatimonadaceae bacterium]
MCTQSVGLLAGVLEQHGIATVCIALVRSVAEKVRPPRALAVPFRFGAPLCEVNDAIGQLAVMRAALALLAEAGPPALLRDYRAWSDA